MAKHQVFFGFEYNKDVWRASQVRNMGKVSDESTFSDNDWEEVKEKSDEKIKEWINDQMKMRSCIVVLVGKSTASRKWVKYEIEKAYELNKTSKSVIKQTNFNLMYIIGALAIMCLLLAVGYKNEKNKNK